MRIGKYMSEEGRQKCIEELSPVAGCILNMKQGKFTAKALSALETIRSCQHSDLKIDTGNSRVWLSRCSTLDDAEYDNEIIVEVFRGGLWITVDTYAGGAV